jgi:hypothetical protein
MLKVLAVALGLYLLLGGPVRILAFLLCLGFAFWLPRLLSGAAKS